MGIRDKPIAPGSRRQNGVSERLIGSIRRERVNRIIVLSETHSRRTLACYKNYYIINLGASLSEPRGAVPSSDLGKLVARAELALKNGKQQQSRATMIAADIDRELLALNRWQARKQYSVGLRLRLWLIRRRL
jgi:hypothetical protein